MYIYLYINRWLDCWLYCYNIKKSIILKDVNTISTWSQGLEIFPSCYSQPTTCVKVALRPKNCPATSLTPQLWRRRIPWVPAPCLLSACLCDLRSAWKERGHHVLPGQEAPRQPCGDCHAAPLSVLLCSAGTFTDRASSRAVLLACGFLPTLSSSPSIPMKKQRRNSGRACSRHAAWAPICPWTSRGHQGLRGQDRSTSCSLDFGGKIIAITHKRPGCSQPCHQLGEAGSPPPSWSVINHLKKIPQVAKWNFQPSLSFI